MEKLELFKELINTMKSLDLLIDKSEKNLNNDKEINHSHWFDLLYKAAYHLSEAKRNIRAAMLKEMNIENEDMLLILAQLTLKNVEQNNFQYGINNIKDETKSSDYNIDNVSHNTTTCKHNNDMARGNVYDFKTEEDVQNEEMERYNEVKNIILKSCDIYNAKLVSIYSYSLDCRIILDWKNNEIYYNNGNSKLTMVDIETLLEEVISTNKNE